MFQCLAILCWNNNVFNIGVCMQEKMYQREKSKEKVSK